VATSTKLLGLLGDVLLPGETRSFAPPALDRAALQRLRLSDTHTITVVCITAWGELPSMVIARWGTVAEVLQIDEHNVTLRGLQRACIQTALGDVQPHAATIETEVTHPDNEDHASWIRGAHRVLAALDLGARPSHEGWQPGLRDSLAALLRSLSESSRQREWLDRPIPEGLEALAEAWSTALGVKEAECSLEGALRKVAEEPKLGKTDRRRLWSQLVGLQRRLDLFDPEFTDNDLEELSYLEKRLQQGGLPKEARSAAKRGLRMLRKMETSNHDYATMLGHLDFMARLPWHPDPGVEFDLAALRRELDAEHAGLQTIKQRILEYFAVRQLGGKAKGTVLCLAGPPGTGKTSLAVAIARALRKPLARVALGGVHDESELRGHRLSFVAAAPGRILRGIADVGSASCVMLLDEVDKVGTDRGRSPQAALLEVLDPQQNEHFRDNYLGVPFDLSDVLFICTANRTEDISGPLRDRLEILELEGYSTREKLAIASSHLVPRVAADCGLFVPPEIPASVLETIIEQYTREAGVRELTRKLGDVFRARALEQVTRGSKTASMAIDVGEVAARLGPARYRERPRVDGLPIGVATGLGVMGHGGARLFVEVGRLPGKGELRLTGRLGEIMRESARTVLGHLRLFAAAYGIEGDASPSNYDWHVHMPEAAIAKEGPSAGVALLAGMLSVSLGKALPASVGMTGEVSLMGDVLAVGGIRAKLLAAERAGLVRVLIPAENVADVPEGMAMEVIPVASVAEAARALGLSGDA